MSGDFLYFQIMVSDSDFRGTTVRECIFIVILNQRNSS